MGYQAQRIGANIEGWVDASLKVYHFEDRLFSQVNYPEIHQKGYKATVIGKAGPDRTAVVTDLGGRCIQMEIKTWAGKDRHLYRFTGGKSEMRRREQYLTLLEWDKFGAITFYLVCWRHKSFDRDWRIHPVRDIPWEQGRGLQFIRESGILVRETNQGWPDWLAPIIEAEHIF